MADVMQKNDGNLARLDLAKELEIVSDENTLLKEENARLKTQIENLMSKESKLFKAAEDERKATVLFLKNLRDKITGIPSIVRFLREVLSDIIIKINNGEHID
jgi:cell division septum initiation protein DivIVA